MARKEQPSPSPSPEAILERGNEHLDAGEVEEARRCFEEAVGLWPSLADGYVHLGLIYFDQREFVAAKVLFERALDLLERQGTELDAPTAEDARLRLLQAKRRGAEERGNPAIALSPAHASAGPIDENLALRALHGSGLCAYWLGNYPEALQTYHEILGRDPSDSLGVRFLVGELHHRLGNLRKANAAYANSPEDPHVAFNHALCLLALGQTRDAIAQVLRAFFKNLYVPAFLLNDSPPWVKSTEPWQHASTQWPDIAVQYLELCADLWRDTTGAVGFLQRIWNDRDVQGIVASYIDLSLRLSNEPDFRHRAQIQRKLSDLQSERAIQAHAATLARRYLV